MTWKPRIIAPDELDTAIDLTAVAFGVGPVAPSDYRREVTLAAEPDRVFVVEDGPAIVGTGGHYSFEMAMPGGVVPMGGVTWIGVLPTYRRRGILRALMDALVDQAIERGEPVAGLTASEGGIYRRFGFGVAARFQGLTVDRARSAEVVDVPDRGRVRLVPGAEVATLLPAVWDAHWRRIPGETGRSPGWWESLVLDPESDRGGASPRFVVVHEDEYGAPDGFALYRMRQVWEGGARHELQVQEVAAADDAAEAALVRFLLDIDLVESLVWWAAPTDLPLRWRLADPRALRVTAERDHLWLRPLDVARCLGSRRYAASGGLVVEVVDRARPELGGRFRLDAGPDGAACARSDADPDLVVGTAELGSLLLGGVSWATLRRAALVGERSAGAVDRADALFRPTRAPFCATDF